MRRLGLAAVGTALLLAACDDGKKPPAPPPSGQGNKRGEVVRRSGALPADSPDVTAPQVADAVWTAADNARAGERLALPAGGAAPTAEPATDAPPAPKPTRAAPKPAAVEPEPAAPAASVPQSAES
jgi:hypothetical protein